MLRRDRTIQSRGGGVTLYGAQHAHLQHFGLSTPTGDAETLCCNLNVRGTSKLLIDLVYRPLGNMVELDNNLVRELLSHIANARHLLLIGDFNTPHISWDQLTTDSSQNAFSSRLLRLAIEELLHQHVGEPSRYAAGNMPSLLDLI